jgi:hypothetical protein
MIRFLLNSPRIDKNGLAPHDATLVSPALDAINSDPCIRGNVLEVSPGRPGGPCFKEEREGVRTATVVATSDRIDPELPVDEMHVSQSFKSASALPRRRLAALALRVGDG